MDQYQDPIMEGSVDLPTLFSQPYKDKDTRKKKEQEFNHVYLWVKLYADDPYTFEQLVGHGVNTVKLLIAVVDIIRKHAGKIRRTSQNWEEWLEAEDLEELAKYENWGVDRLPGPARIRASIRYGFPLQEDDLQLRLSAFEYTMPLDLFKMGMMLVQAGRIVGYDLDADNIFLPEDEPFLELPIETGSIETLLYHEEVWDETEEESSILPDIGTVFTIPIRAYNRYIDKTGTQWFFYAPTEETYFLSGSKRKTHNPTKPGGGKYTIAIVESDGNRKVLAQAIKEDVLSESPSGKAQTLRVNEDDIVLTVRVGGTEEEKLFELLHVATAPTPKGNQHEQPSHGRTGHQDTDNTQEEEA